MIYNIAPPPPPELSTHYVSRGGTERRSLSSYQRLELKIIPIGNRTLAVAFSVGRGAPTPLRYLITTTIIEVFKDTFLAFVSASYLARPLTPNQCYFGRPRGLTSGTNVTRHFNQTWFLSRPGSYSHIFIYIIFFQLSTAATVF